MEEIVICDAKEKCFWRYTLASKKKHWIFTESLMITWYLFLCLPVWGKIMRLSTLSLKWQLLSSEKRRLKLNYDCQIFLKICYFSWENAIKNNNLFFFFAQDGFTLPTINIHDLYTIAGFDIASEDIFSHIHGNLKSKTYCTIFYRKQNLSLWDNIILRTRLVV